MKRLQLLCCAAAFLAVACASSTSDVSERKADVLMRAGIESLQANDPTQAVRSLQEAVRLSPKKINAWSNLGVAFANKEEFSRAEECFKKALQLNPSFSDARLNLGSLYVRMHRFSDAERQLKEAGKDLGYANLYQVSYDLAMLYFAEGKTSLGEQQLRATVRERPNFCPAWYRLGILQKERNEFHEAALSLKNAVGGTCFKNPEAHYEIASLYLKAHEYNNAKTKLLEIIQLFPDSDWAKKAVASLNLMR
jgi:type IV pilus assembly protein PilF